MNQRLKRQDFYLKENLFFVIRTKNILFLIQNMIKANVLSSKIKKTFSFLDLPHTLIL